MTTLRRPGQMRSGEHGGDDGGQRARRRRRFESRGLSMATNFAPMIDVTFLLLIFFLVTTTFERAEGILASNIPRDAGPRPAVALPVSPIVVRLDQPGPEHDEFTLSVDRFSNVPQDFNGLTAFLRSVQERSGFDRDTPVVIVAADNVRWDHVVGCWNAALRAECMNIAFAEP